MKPLVVAVLASFVLVGCSTSEPPSAQTSVAATAAAPSTLTYPAVGVDGVDLAPTGLTNDGEFAVPPLDEAAKVVYAAWSPELAKKMPTVVASHVSGRAENGQPVPGGFARLKDAEVGDEITVGHADGVATRYVVRAVDTIDKDTFPTAEVYNETATDQLKLITCGGVLDTVARSYEANVIVSAEAVA